MTSGGLAGCEAAWQAARSGCAVRLFEMHPGARTPAHQTYRLAELVCNNSLKSESLDDASGLLQVEMRAGVADPCLRRGTSGPGRICLGR